jgi:hypothetical protein
MTSLDRFTQVVTIVTCLVVVTHVGLTQYESYLNRPRPPYGAGDVIADTASLGLSQAPMTLLIGTTSTCAYRQQSMPFYEKVSTLAGTTGVRVVAYTHEPVDRNRKFFDEHRVATDTIVDARENRL